MRQTGYLIKTSLLNEQLLAKVLKENKNIPINTGIEIKIKKDVIFLFITSLL